MIILDTSGSMISDARIEAANAFVRALLVLLTDRQPGFRLAVIAAGQTIDVIGVHPVGRWRWVDLPATPRAIGSLSDALLVARGAGSAVVLVTDDGSGAADLPDQPDAVVLVRRGQPMAELEAVLETLIPAGGDDGDR